MPSDQELSGDALYGDDFSIEQIEAWYHDEENAYAELYAHNPDYEYEYEPMNVANGFSKLPAGRFTITVGLGSAFGDELRPIAARIDKLIIVESADSYRESPALPIPTEWRKASVTGDLDLPDSTADLITCFGVLHHIPNVSHVLREMGRVTTSGGYALVREPVVTMGDWTRPRSGLTPRERGIPRDYFVAAARAAGFEVVSETWCFFSLVGLVGRKLHMDVYRKPHWVWLDAALSRAFAWNYRYHARGPWQKIRPTSVFFVLRKF